MGFGAPGFATSASGGPIRLLFDSFAQFCQNFTEGNSGSGNGVQSNKPKSEEQAAKSEKVRDMDSSELEGTLHVGASGMSKEEEMAIELMNQQTNQATNNDQDEDDVKRRKSESATTVSSVSENDTTASSLGIESEEYSTSFATSDKESSDGEGYLPGALLNVRSMSKHIDEVLEVIENHKLDFLCTTETWLNPSNYNTVLSAASPSTFKFHHEAGQDEPVRGVEGTVYGGVAIQYKDENKEKEQERICFSPTFKPVFDIVAMVLENDKLEVPVVLVNLYISPKKIKAHFGEFVRHFEELLCILKKKGYDHVIITGDFNIHMDNPEDPSVQTFCDLLVRLGLNQHTHGATRYPGGHTLDLVITLDVAIRKMKKVYNKKLSDHCLILFEARPVTRRRDVKK
ncbi:uncharacterized protein LOC115543895 [Gadus morhua]|uniref:uncharacterized protein LOC115543895 n=1 Tax=Gadus morhua TaxID=8049 RepID=UPI0011B681C7|nr:uncharacterized protein LOC115543895 [Gadus morhua]